MHPKGLQQRFFTYDLAGLLTSEQHPEKGTNGNGTVRYPEYDARGHLRHRIDGAVGGPFDVTFIYDGAERLTNVQDLNPANNNPRDLKFFEYGIDNPSNNPRLGKLKTATRHNYQPALGGDITVAETYTYGGPNGRVSVRDTTIGGALTPNTFSLAQSWDDLGNAATVTYPSNAAFASTPQRTVGYSYTNALLTGVNGYTNGMTHTANGLLSHVGHANGENEDWFPDPNGMSRPASIQITSSAGASKLIGPYTYDSPGNIKQIGDTTATHTVYRYDGAGRLENAVDIVPSVPPAHSVVFTYDSFGNKLGDSLHRFDPNGDGIMSSSDIFYLVNYLFLHGPPPRGEDGLLSGDANNDGVVTSSDIFFVVNYLFLGGPAPTIPIEALPGPGESVPTPGNEPDSITVGTVAAAGNTVDVPVYIRDVPGTLLDRDHPHGSKIQSFAIKVAYSPASSVSSVTFTRSGITANLTPSAEFNPSTANTISLIDTFQESSNLLPLASHAPAPGNQVAHLVFTLSGSAAPGSSIAITLDPSVTLLSDEGGNTSESHANGTLVLVDGAINIPSQMGTAPIASMAPKPADTVPSSIQREQSLRPARFLNNAKLTAGSTRFSPRTSTYTGTTNHDAAFTYDEAGDVLNDDKGRSFTYDALSMTTGATAPMTNGGGNRNFAYIYTADDERIALVETLNSAATMATWTLRGLDNHLLRTWTNSSTSGWSWREDDIWRGAALLANESSIGVRHYGLDHLGSPAILTDALAHPIGGPLTFDAFGNGGATGAGMLEYTGQERDSFNVGPSPGTVNLPDYLHARYYDSARGRFLSVDPHADLKKNASEPQRWNRYAYVTNQPLLYVDPNGADSFAAFFLGEQYRNTSSVKLLFAPGFQAQLKDTWDRYWSSKLNRVETVAYGAILAMYGYRIITAITPEAVATTTAATGPIAETARRVLSDPNKMDHIFEADHLLGHVVDRLGSEGNVVTAVSDRLYALQAAGNLGVDPSNGGFRAYVSVGGEVVTVSGRVIDGTIAIGNFWIPQ